MHPLGPKKNQIIIASVIIAFIGIAFVAFYSIHLLNQTNLWNNDKEESIDIYNQKLQYDLGISADNYEERELYNIEQYEVDRIQIIKNIKNKRYDLVEDTSKFILAKYKFDNQLLSIFSTLTNSTIFEQEETESEAKIIFVSSLVDPEMYVLFFSELTVTEQSILIEYENVNILPEFDYSTIQLYTKEGGPLSPFINLIGQQQYYEVHLTYRSVEYIVYLVNDNSMKIFKIDNTTNTMDGFKYK